MQFEEVLGLSDPKEDLRQRVDPGLGDNYPLDSVFKVMNLIRRKLTYGHQILIKYFAREKRKRKYICDR